MYMAISGNPDGVQRSVSVALEMLRFVLMEYQLKDSQPLITIARAELKVRVSYVIINRRETELGVQQ
jgi:hypothetical protein